jgi:nucleotide sugar dehydrogenase
VILNISIIGLGSVGNAAFTVLQEHHSVTGYDIDGRGSWEDVISSEATLVCVSTDAGDNNRLDMSNINSVAKRLSDDTYQGVMIVKSTLQPGTMDSIAKRHPNLNISYVPEFLREKDAIEWFANPDRIVYSADQQSEQSAISCFGWVPASVPRLKMAHLEAEFAKLAHNAYIATKVTFTCEIERIAKSRGIDPHAIMEAVWTDRRINNPAHLTPGLGGYSGKCVPKDTAALASEDLDLESLLHHLEKRGGAEAASKRGV